MGYGITATVQDQINAAISGQSEPHGERRCRPVRRVYIERDHLRVVNWGAAIVKDYGVCSIIDTPDRRDHRIDSPEARQIAADYWDAKLDLQRAQTRLWSWSEQLRAKTSLTRSEAKRLKADAERRIGECFDRAKALVDAEWPSASEWEL